MGMRSKCSVALAFVLSAFCCAPAAAIAADLTDAYEPEVALVSVSDDVSADEVREQLEAIDGVASVDVTPSDIASGVVRVELEPGVEVSDAVSELENSDVVAEAQPNFYYEVLDEEESLFEAMSVQVNDPKAGDQWGLGSILAYDAWSLRQVNRSVTVAVLDLGVNVSHEDLKDNIVGAYNAYNANNGGNTSDVTPTASNVDHGTHVAGIIAAVSNNGIGVSGVSYNAKIMPIKVVRPDGLASTTDLIKAYDYLMSKASQYNIRVVNISLGMRGSTSPDDAFLRKITEAYNKGIVTVAAAGNAGSNGGKVPYETYPGDFDKVVSVINLQSSGNGVKRYSTSNYNAAGERDKNISAPGTDILSTYNAGYGNKTGTSMAAPHVSAVLALMFAANSSLNAEQAINLLYSSATDLGAAGFDNEYGWGEVNANAAVKAALGGSGSNTPAPTPTPEDTLPVRTCRCYR